MALFLRFWRDYARRFRVAYLLGIVFLVATNYLQVAIPGFVQHAVDALGHGEGSTAAAHWAVAVLVAGLGILVVRTLSRTLFFNPGRTLEFQVKLDMFDRLLALPRRFFDRMRPGEIISRGTNDTNWMRALIGFGSLQLFNVILTLGMTLVKMVWVDWRMTLWCVLPLAVASLVLRFAVGQMFKFTQQFQAETAALSDRVLEAYNGVGVLQAFRAQRGTDARFDEANERLQDLGLRLNGLRSWALPIVSVVGSLCVVIVLYVGGARVTQGTLTVGELAAFTVYINILVTALTGFGWLVNAVQRGWISLGRVYELLEAPLERPEAQAPMPAPGERGPALEIEGLTFRYPLPDAPEVLRDLSFRLEPGETVGVFGLTGAGKSTLLQLIARVYEPPPGSIKLAGSDVRDLPIRDYRGVVTYVPQEAFLFSTSLRENVALSESGTVIDERRVQQAVADAALMDDLAALPDGLDTIVGERGITLSGGQRQRAALARAFYRDYGVLLLDDVMSAVDHATEKRLIDAVYRRGRTPTTLIVSHRCSVLARADRILVMDAGRLVATGTHEALVGQDGPYARAWHLQQAAEAIEAEEGVA